MPVKIWLLPELLNPESPFLNVHFILTDSMIQFLKGNLLGSTATALVNTVNTVGVMGKGIALQFKEAFPVNNRKFFPAL